MIFFIYEFHNKNSDVVVLNELYRLDVVCLYDSV